MMYVPREGDTYFGLYNDALWLAALEWDENSADSEFLVILKEMFTAYMNNRKSLDSIAGRLGGEEDLQVLN
jgi:hypothetical protein